MRTRCIALLFCALLVVASCSSTPKRDDALFYPVWIELQYADCFAAAGGVLPGSQSSVFTKRPKGTNVVGYVTVTANNGQTFTFDVGTAPNTGQDLSMPADTQTITALERVGC